jgi:hypothetical protein
MWQSNATRPVVIVICVATCSPVLRAAPFSFDATPGRLPKLTDERLDGQPASQVVSDDAQQLTTVRLSQAAAPGTHTPTFAYTGRIETQPHGLFVQPFIRADGTRDLLLSTKMESTEEGARVQRAEKALLVDAADAYVGRAWAGAER